MDSLVLIEQLDELMAEARPIPFTREARVDRDEVYKILDRLRTTLPVEFERARWMGREDGQDETVESQLREIGASLTELRRGQHAQAQRPNRPPITVAAAEQVREIVEAAERTAIEVEQKAAAEAKRLQAAAESTRQSAQQEAERLLSETRERAAADAAEYLRRVEEATKKMLERAAAADSEMDGMIARLRGSGGSVIEDLEAIMAGLTEIEVRRANEPAEDGEKVAAGDRAKPAAAATAAPGRKEGAQQAAAVTRRPQPSPQGGPVSAQRLNPAQPARQAPAAENGSPRGQAEMGQRQRTAPERPRPRPQSPPQRPRPESSDAGSERSGPPGA